MATRRCGEASRAAYLCGLYDPGPQSPLSHYGPAYHLSVIFRDEDDPMLDLAFLILGAGLFLGALIYARACANV